MAEPKKPKPKASTSAPKKAPSRSPSKAKADQPEAKTKAKAAPKPKGKAATQSKPKGGAKKSESSAAIYTDPKLRDRLKDEITAGDKGGKPGQWSARKAQLLASEYEKAGGDYKNGKKKKTEAQEHLDSWTKEDWKTADDQPAEREGGTTRYLPAAAWDQLTPAQKKATNAKKQAGSEAGQQFVANTDDAKAARKSAAEDDKPAAKPKAKPKSAAAPQAKAKAAPQAKARKKSSG